MGALKPWGTLFRVVPARRLLEAARAASIVRSRGGGLYDHTSAPNSRSEFTDQPPAAARFAPPYGRR
ncbi:MAG: hypothetical protein CMJ59_23995 [Planctomycetaceae bacterium]|nr:hypothetical protein [Planctomycetaceae bacterium]